MSNSLDTIKRKKAAEQNGKNIRVSTDGHTRLSDFCRDENYLLGGFVEMAAIEKMETLQKAKKTKKTKG